MSNKNYCSPIREVEFSGENTCFSYDDLKNIAIEYNKLNPNKKIKISKNKARLYERIKKAMKNVCNNEFCIGDKFLPKHKINDIFRPTKPIHWYKNKREWLSTTDINFVMKQYQDVYKDFLYIGTFPMDFSSKVNNVCIGKSLCDFNIKKDLKNKKRFGFVLNTDYNDQSGSHWIAIYCNTNKKLKNYGIYYYNSTANVPTIEVKNFFSIIKSQIKDDKFEINYNKIQKQFKNSECGMFSMLFLIQCLKNIPFKKICKIMPKDDEINRLRDVLYTPSIDLITS
jgi:hypothetical protein